MNKKNTLHVFLTVFFVFGILTINAQTKVYVHETNGTAVEYSISDLDSISFNSPVPTQIYIHKTNGTAVEYKITDLDSIRIMTEPIVISEHYIPIDWDNTNIITYDSAGNIQLQFTDSLPNIKIGNVFVLIVNDSVSSIRKVISSSLQGSTYELQTEEGDLSDIFLSGSFILSSDNATLRAKAKGNSNSNIFYPEKIGYSDGSMLKSQKGEINGKLLDVSIPLNQIELWGSPDSVSKFTYESGSLGIGLNMLLEFNFNNKNEMIEKVTGNLMELKVSMVGSLDIESLISFTINSKLEFGKTEILKKKNLIPPKYLWFNVQGVPIFIMLKSDLLADLQLSIEGKLNAKVGTKYNLTTKSGFAYNQETNKITNFTESSQTIDVVPPTISGEAEVSFKPSLYPRFYVYLYGLVGPTVDIKPYIDFTAKAKYIKEFLVKEKPFASMEFAISLGLNLQSRLHYKPFYLKNDKDLLTLDEDLLNFEIFRSPHKIVKENTDYQKNEVTFTVYDTLAYSKTVQPTSLPLSVKISKSNDDEIESETLNEVINETTNEMKNGNGTLTYKFDSSEPTTIEASIYNVNGVRISKAEHEVDEREMLIAFYKSTNGDNWIRNDNWCSDKPTSEWYGVKTWDWHHGESIKNRVYSLELPNNNLTGSAHFADLRSLYRLNILDGNKIESLTIDNCGNEIPDNNLNDYNSVFWHSYTYSPCNLKTLKISNTNAYVYVNGNFSAESVIISNCNLSAREYIYFDLPSTTVGTLTVSNCKMGYFYADNSTIGNILIDNCTFLEDEYNNNAYIYVGNRTQVNNCRGLQYIYSSMKCPNLIVTNTICNKIYCDDKEE